MRERELKRALPAEEELPDLGDAIPGAVLSPAEVRQVDDRYHDTADLRLARWGVTLRWRQGTGWTLKLPRPDQKRSRKEAGALDRDELVLTGRPGAPPPRAQAVISSLTRGGPLVPVVHLVNERSGRIWHGADGAAVAEQVDDRVTATVLLDTAGGAAREVRFREVEVELAVDADPSVLDRVAERLPIDPAFPAAPKLIRVLGPAATAPPDVVVLPLPADPTAADVVTAAVASSVQRLLLRLPQVHLDLDPEGVHQARVATRRLRSDLRTFRSLLDPGPVGELRAELAWLGGELGRVRDADVLGQELQARLAAHPEIDAADAAEVLRLLDRERKAALKALTADLVSPRAMALLDRLVVAAAAPPLTVEVAADGGGPAAEILPPLVAKSWRRLRRHVRHLGDDPSDEALHETRILAKRVRYAAEAVAPAAPRAAARFARHAAAIQGELGDQHDAVVAAQWLEAHAGALRGRSAFAAGRLAQAFTTDAASGAQSWQRHYDKLAAHTGWLEP